MRPGAPLALLAALVAAACGRGEAGGPEFVDVERVGEREFRLSLPAAELDDPARAQQLLLPAAVELCGADAIRFGEFAFDAGADPPKLVQDLTCEPPPPPPAPFDPTPDQEAAVAALTERFFTARNAADAAAARRLFRDDWSEVDAERWRTEAEAFNRLAGTETRRAVTRTLWFENPPESPDPGVFAALDYTSSFENVRTACGFVLWRREADGFRLVREQLDHLTPEAEAGLSGVQLAEARAKLGCR
ncbi:MAG: DUF4019 domain-containing protein [Phenylobacterium sp.]|uniref:DUF4019 domain-containing protein n=1 Tax=Phenylobacterium sp. TaxID=1871053 RepID=UPI00391AA2FE